jgi:HlyD family secretion protein
VSSIAERDRAEVAFDSGQTQLTAARARQLAAVSAQTGSQAAIRIAAAQLEHALAQVTLREAVVRQVRVELEHTVIRTPIDGIVIERNIDIGQTVAASLQAPTLFTIAPDLRAMQVHANVDEADIGRVVSGQEVSFAVDSFPGRSFQGRVVDIRKMPQSTQNVVAYTVVISADNDDLLLLPGMTANARILVQERDDVLRVPNAAIRFRPAGKPKLSTSAGARELPPERLLRSALNSMGLPIDRRHEIDLVVEKAGCAAREGENKSPRSNGRGIAMLKACGEASRRVIEILSEEERGRYQEARSLLARDTGTAAAEVWVVGPAGTPEARRVLLGVTDGLMTEIAGGDLRKGDRVIVGAEADLPRSAGLAGF